jgi:hypothetical protein
LDFSRWTVLPVPIPDEKACLSLKGKVTDIMEVELKTLYLSLEGFDQKFYVNRGLKKELELNN